MPQFLVAPKDVCTNLREAVLRGEEARHLLNVFRARSGDSVLLFDGVGNRWSSRLVQIAPGVGEARLGDLSPLPPNEPSIEMTLVQSVPKGDRWEWILEKATELGVARIVPAHSRHSVALVPEDRKRPRALRWRGVTVAAAKQCERGRVPEILQPVELSQFLSGLSKRGSGEARIVLSARLEARAALPSGPIHSVILAVGPEGGWSPEEMDAFQQADFVPLGLGPRVLRADTAALAGLVAVHHQWGELVPKEPQC